MRVVKPQGLACGKEKKYRCSLTSTNCEHYFPPNVNTFRQKTSQWWGKNKIASKGSLFFLFFCKLAVSRDFLLSLLYFSIFRILRRLFECMNKKIRVQKWSHNIVEILRQKTAWVLKDFWLWMIIFCEYIIAMK